MFYNGNLDIVCHHSGTLELFNAMSTWSGIGAYHNAQQDVYKMNGETVGYLKSVQNLRLFTIRNAGHMAPRNQPEVAYEMFSKFLDGTF